MESPLTIISDDAINGLVIPEFIVPGAGGQFEDAA